MEVQILRAKKRETGSKGAARQDRLGGSVPVVLYGGGGDPVSLKLDLREFDQLLHGRSGEHAVVRLEVEDSADLNSPALLKAVQHDPINGSILHADFMRIRLDQRITTSVVLSLLGRAVGVTEGGVLDHQLRDIEVECLALEVPETIAVDVSELNIGDSLHVSQVVAPEGVTIVTDPERTIVAVHAPRVVKEAAAEEGEEGAEEGAEGAAGDEGGSSSAGGAS